MPQDKESSEKTRAGKENGASRFSEHPGAHSEELLAILRTSSTSKGCAIAEGQEAGPAAQGETDSNGFQIAKCVAAADALISLADSQGKPAPAVSDCQATGQMSEGEVGGGDLNVTAASIATKQPSQPEQNSNLDAELRTDCVSLVLGPSQQDMKKQRKYANKCRVQYQRWIEKLRVSEEDVVSRLKTWRSAHCQMLRCERSKPYSYWTILATSHGCYKLREACLAVAIQTMVFREQLVTTKAGLQYLLWLYPWDDWGREIWAITEERSSTAKKYLDSDFFARPPADVVLLLKTWPPLSLYMTVLGQWVEGMKGLIQEYFEFAAFCDRKGGMPSVFEDLHPSTAIQLPATQQTWDMNKEIEDMIAFFEGLADRTEDKLPDGSKFYGFLGQYIDIRQAVSDKVYGELIAFEESKRGDEFLDVWDGAEEEQMSEASSSSKKHRGRAQQPSILEPIMEQSMSTEEDGDKEEALALKQTIEESMARLEKSGTRRKSSDLNHAEMEQNLVEPTESGWSSTMKSETTEEEGGLAWDRSWVTEFIEDEEKAINTPPSEWEQANS